MTTPVYEQRMRDAGHIITIEAMHTKINGSKGLSPDFVEFYPYLENYAENYNSAWKTEDIWGRPDGISNYSNTRREIPLAIRIVAYDEEQAKENQLKISKFIQFLYPAITKKNGINNYKASPILRITFGNLIASSQTNKGLYGFINGGVNVKPIHKDGYFAVGKTVKLANGELSSADPRRDASSQDVVIYWKHFDISFNFTVVHDHQLGNDVDDIGASRFWKEYYPFGLGTADFKISKNQKDPTDYTPDYAADLDTDLLTPQLNAGGQMKDFTLAPISDLSPPSAIEQIQRRRNKDKILK